MLRACVISSKGSWEKWLPLAEFLYNNSYQESIKMAPFEVVYGRKCRTPLNWVEVGERRYYGIDFVEQAKEQVRTIKIHMAAAQCRHKSYADHRRKSIEFEVGDFVYLKVSPMKSVKRFGVKRKLAPRYVGPFQIIGKSEAVAYKIQLPPEMSTIFNVFHVSQLKKYLRVPKERVPLGDIKLESDLTYEEKPVRVVDTRERVTQSQVVKWYKVMWSNQGSESDATWEREDYLRKGYKEFYQQWYAFQISG
jgi:hypothetical protein